MNDILIETDLLLAFIKEEDRLKTTAKKVLQGIHSGELDGFYASTTVIQEIIFWFSNREMTDELMSAVNALIHIENLRWVELSTELCLAASVLMNEYRINPFDAYHLATSIQNDKMILSTDHVFDRVKGVKRVVPEDFVKTL